jgi:hypothetical protein
MESLCLHWDCLAALETRFAMQHMRNRIRSQVLSGSFGDVAYDLRQGQGMPIFSSPRNVLDEILVFNGEQKCRPSICVVKGEFFELDVVPATRGLAHIEWPSDDRQRNRRAMFEMEDNMSVGILFVEVFGGRELDI